MNSKRVIILGTLLYAVIAPFFFHPDLKIIYYLTQFLSQGVFNIYEYVATHPEANILGPFVYPPISYFFFGVNQFVIKLLAGSDFTKWLAMGNEAVGVPHIFRYLLLIKLPLIGVHAISAVILTRLVSKAEHKVTVAAWWFFNPISIYVVAMMGQIDGLAVLSLILAAVLVHRRPLWAAVILGLGAATKTFPLLFLPFIAILGERKISKQVTVLVAGVATYLLCIGPFLLTPAFYGHTLASGLTQRVLTLGLDIGFGEKILIVPALLIGLLLIAWHRDLAKREKVTQYFLAVALVLLSGMHFHLQWLMWIVPFLGIYMIHGRSWLAVCVMMVGIVAIGISFADKFLTFGLVSPMNPGIFFLPPPITLLPVEIITMIKNFGHTLFAASALWIGIDYLRKDYE